MFNDIRETLRGKKTYIIVITSIGFAIIQYLEGSISYEAMVQGLQVALLGSTLRAGIAGNAK